MSAIFSPTGAKTGLLDQITLMTDLVEHRGPDDEGYVIGRSQMDVFYCSGGDTSAQCTMENLGVPNWQSVSSLEDQYSEFVLGHRRLSIVDTGYRGHQPFSDPAARVHLVYNGEIYNHPELRRELISKGHRFSTECDTEVVLRAWLEWGEDCLHRFNGMFALVLVDMAKGCAFVARDRFGIKPLYYFFSPDGCLYFSSEIKQFTACESWHPRLNFQRAYDFLAWEMIDHTDETLFDNVFQLRGGQCATIELNGFVPEATGRLATRQWYELPAINSTDSQITNEFEQQYSKQMRVLLENSVRLRLRADVEVGSCLSGGLDSSSIVMLMDQLLEQQGAGGPVTFSAYSERASINEEKWVDIVVSGSRATGFNTTPALSKLLIDHDRVLWHQDEPFRSSSIFAQWSVFNLVSSQNIKVVLDGQGADEQLAGYPASFGLRIYEIIKEKGVISGISEMMTVRKIHGHSWAIMLAWTLEYCLPPRLANLGRRLMGANQATPAWLNEAHTSINTERPGGNWKYGLKTLSELGRFEMQVSGLPALLHWEDRNSMAHSVEARVPFLDVELVEFLAATPSKYKIQNGTTKIVLREAMRRILPDAIRLRQDKIGFQTSEQEWLADPRAKAQIMDNIQYAIDHSSGLLKSEVRAMADDMLSGRKPYKNVVWRWQCFGAWLRLFGVDGSTQDSQANIGNFRAEAE